MARTFDGPLTADDQEWLKARYSTSYVERMVTLHGVAKAPKGSKKAETPAAEPETSATPEVEAETPAGPENGSEEGDDLDLIGDTPAGETFHVLDKTEAEIREWVATAAPEDKAVALAVESAREDRDPRKGVVTLLS